MGLFDRFFGRRVELDPAARQRLETWRARPEPGLSDDFRATRLVVVEASNGQLEDEMRLAISHRGVHRPPVIDHVRRFGGILPQQKEIVDRVLAGTGHRPVVAEPWEVRA